MELLKSRLAQVRSELETASEGLYPAPRLIAVTKTHPAQDILPLAELGVTEIGENRVQEIMDKLPLLEGKFQIHCIGRLQTNKVKYIIEHACLIQSVDRLALAQEIDRQAQRAGVVMPVLIQVSPCGEEQKGGMPPDEVLPFLRTIAGWQGLSVRGLMAVMPHTEDQQLLGQLFARMRSLYEHLQCEAVQGVRMEELSMGMSGDYRLAAAHGATMVRVGSAIFGPRDYTGAKQAPTP